MKISNAFLTVSQKMATVEECGARPTSKVPYTVAQLRKAYVAVNNLDEKKFMHKARVFFCIQVQLDDRILKELRANPEKYPRRSILMVEDEDVAKQTMQKVIDELKEHNARKTDIDTIQAILDECESNNRSLMVKHNDLRQKYRDVIQEQKISKRNLLKAANAVDDAFNSKFFDMLFTAINPNDEVQIEKWRGLLSAPQLAEFESRLVKARNRAKFEKTVGQKPPKAVKSVEGAQKTMENGGSLRSLQ